MDDSSSGIANLGQFAAAKIKLDDLFLSFLISEGQDKIASFLVEASKLQNDEGSLLSERDKLVDAESKTSPTHQSSAPKSLLYKKSPKKRTQSEMSSNSSNNNSKSPVSQSVEDMGRLSIGLNNNDNNSNNNSSVIMQQDSDESIELNTQFTQNSHKKLVDQQSEDHDDHDGVRRKKILDKIPQFYIPGRRAYIGRPVEDDRLVKRHTEIEAFFKPFPGGIPVEKFVHVTKRLCGIPSFFNLPLCRRINERYGDPDAGIPAPRTVGKAGRQPSGVKIRLKSFLKFWQQEIEPYDRIERFFRIIKKHDADYIVKDDFVPFLQELLHFHPGLDFLEAHEEFQRKYALTVITRIFYRVNTSRSGKISLREVRRSNLFQACMHVDEETDINKVLDYFSYEHFYVIYCKFFELDSDKDSKLTKTDLLKYGEHALSEAIVDRIFQVGTKVFTDGQIGGFDSGLSYPDFIFFMLSEEDKTTECSLAYWFRCCDLDGDGYLSPEEMRFFYRNQIHRITSLGQESINFSDVLCQMLDMVSPADANKITLLDLTRPDKRMISGVLFDVLFNLHKFMRFESRDPFQEKIRREDVFHTDWDRFAHAEYNRLAQEEEEDANDDNGGYDPSMEVELDTSNNGNAMSGGGWSLNDEEEESEDEDDTLLGNRLVSTTSSASGGGGRRK